MEVQKDFEEGGSVTVYEDPFSDGSQDGVVVYHQPNKKKKNDDSVSGSVQSKSAMRKRFILVNEDSTNSVVVDTSKKQRKKDRLARHKTNTSKQNNDSSLIESRDDSFSVADLSRGKNDHKRSQTSSRRHETSNESIEYSLSDTQKDGSRRHEGHNKKPSIREQIPTSSLSSSNEFSTDSFSIDEVCESFSDNSELRRNIRKEYSRTYMSEDSSSNFDGSRSSRSFRSASIGKDRSISGSAGSVSTLGTHNNKNESRRIKELESALYSLKEEVQRLKHEQEEATLASSVSQKKPASVNIIQTTGENNNNVQESTRSITASRNSVVNNNVQPSTRSTTTGNVDENKTSTTRGSQAGLALLTNGSFLSALTSKTLWTAPSEDRANSTSVNAANERVNSQNTLSNAAVATATTTEAQDKTVEAVGNDQTINEKRKVEEKNHEEGIEVEKEEVRSPKSSVVVKNVQFETTEEHSTKLNETHADDGEVVATNNQIETTNSRNEFSKGESQVVNETCNQQIPVALAVVSGAFLGALSSFATFCNPENSSKTNGNAKNSNIQDEDNNKDAQTEESRDVSAVIVKDDKDGNSSVDYIKISQQEQDQPGDSSTTGTSGVDIGACATPLAVGGAFVGSLFLCENSYSSSITSSSGVSDDESEYTSDTKNDQGNVESRNDESNKTDSRINKDENKKDSRNAADSVQGSNKTAGSRHVISTTKRPKISKTNKDEEKTEGVKIKSGLRNGKKTKGKDQQKKNNNQQTSATTSNKTKNNEAWRKPVSANPQPSVKVKVVKSPFSTGAASSTINKRDDNTTKAKTTTATTVGPSVVIKDKKSRTKVSKKKNKNIPSGKETKTKATKKSTKKKEPTRSITSTPFADDDDVSELTEIVVPPSKQKKNSPYQAPVTKTMKEKKITKTSTVVAAKDSLSESSSVMYGGTITQFESKARDLMNRL